MKAAIFAVARGWVYAGVYEEVYKPTGMYYRVTDGFCVRYWGTTSGLGQLQITGPTEETKLDPIKCVEFHELQMCGMYPLSKDDWRGFVDHAKADK